MEDCGGVHIHFPSEGSGSDRVTIRGPAGEVERAKRQLLQLAEEKVREEEVEEKWQGGLCVVVVVVVPPPEGTHRAA